MIQVIHYLHEATEKPFVSKISAYYDEVRHLLPSLPVELKIYFSDGSIIPETGVGGFAYSHTIITLSVDPDFKDKEIQAKSIRPTIYHEAFHQYQGFTGEDDYRNAIDSAIHEGMATVFQRNHEGTVQPYGDYSNYTEAQLYERVKLLKSVGKKYFEDENVWKKWAFYNHDLNERWILYKTGTWMIDQVLRKTKQDILDLKDKSPAEIMDLFDQ